MPHPNSYQAFREYTRTATTTPEWRKGLFYLKEMVQISTVEEIRPAFEISSGVKIVDIHAFEGFYPLHHSGVASIS